MICCVSVRPGGTSRLIIIRVIIAAAPRGPLRFWTAAKARTFASCAASVVKKRAGLKSSNRSDWNWAEAGLALKVLKTIRARSTRAVPVLRFRNRLNSRPCATHQTHSADRTRYCWPPFAARERWRA